ncbi:MAG TPA: radical SAM protein [Victivallales bacterium]|nr:radical SAM protein [Victivallales bacterium]HPO90455.1 radical SAM protein [Victivallales bacterium]HRR06505.1 radical SAM protein [Victivallales bacterium]HRR28306.1 radical SAM protein [Victivallales bacterium]HRU00546.1 radical SAM protein [Victivallales bacterium]
MKIERLCSGGLIVTYACSSSCSHCLYKSSPKRDKAYIEKEMAKEVFAKIAKLNCKSIHIGGGEPFLRPESLFEITSIASEYDIHIDYVETNASWFCNGSDEILKKCLSSNVKTLLISISPFHNEFIPFSKVTELIKASKKYRINIFPWIIDFADEISAFEQKTTHRLFEYKERYGEDYIINSLSRYGVRFNGRAAEVFSNLLATKTPEHIILENPGPCNELLNTSHFHVDLYGNYIPGLCAGLSLDFKVLDQDFSPNYPLFVLLCKKGISGLYKFAKENFSFNTEKKYIGKCHLCLEIRKHLYRNKVFLNELRPAEFYEFS